MSLSILNQKIKEHSQANNAVRSYIQKLIAEKKAAKETEENPYARMALFAQSNPETPEIAAALMVAAFGYDNAYERAMDFADSSHNSEEMAAWEFLAETIDSLKISASHAEATKGDEPKPEEQAEAERKGIQESFSLNVVLNEKQNAAKELAFQGKSFTLIGPAGSGKTTAQRAVAKALLDAGALGTSSFKHTNPNGFSTFESAPSIAFCAYTRRAASNLRKAVHKDPVLAERLKYNIMTIHSLLEYQPETYYDPIEGKDKFRFAPQRHAERPLNITHLVIEEASMLGLDLWEKLYDAMPVGVQIIFIGDINQLPPVFGPSILNYALMQLPIVELTEVYRNQGIVLENAHHILKGEKLVENDDFVIVRGDPKKQTGQSKMAAALQNMFRKMSETIGDDGLPMYDVDNDIVLSPFNKQDLGTDNMNKWIAQFVGEKRGAIVHEIIAGFNKLYLAVGDKVMYNKRDAYILDIVPNPNYYGRATQLPGADLSRFGHRILGKEANLDLDEAGGDLDYTNFSLDQLADEKAERKQQASHIITLDYGDGQKEEISAAGELQAQTFTLGYCLTVHKAQGSEWRKVFIILHKDHSTMLYRELFYTAVTRARTKVTIFAKDYVIEKAIETQRIKGNTLKDKLAFFNSGVMENGTVRCIKEAA